MLTLEENRMALDYIRKWLPQMRPHLEMIARYCNPDRAPEEIKGMLPDMELFVSRDGTKIFFMEVLDESYTQPRILYVDPIYVGRSEASIKAERGL